MRMMAWCFRIRVQSVLNANNKARSFLTGQSIDCFKTKLRGLFSQGKDRSVQKLIEELNPILQGWINYFRFFDQIGLISLLTTILIHHKTS